MKLKNGSHYLSLFILVLLALSLLCSQAFSAPRPSITANNGTQRVLVMPDMLLDVLIELNPGGDRGRNADWWLFADTAVGYFYYNLNSGWQPGLAVTFQGNLDTLPPLNVLSLAGLPVGTYTMSFGVDLIRNGQIDRSAYLDTVEITIPGYICPDTTNTMDALSAAQKAFIVARGNPDMFVLGFISEEFDNENRAAYLADGNIRRIEYWYYNRDQLTMVLFDNGHFVKETAINDSVESLQATHISPSQLSPCMDQNDIIMLLGEPSCIKTEILAGRTYNYLRYNPLGGHTAATVVLENGVLITVLAGYSYDIDSSPADGNLCTD